MQWQSTQLWIHEGAIALNKGRSISILTQMLDTVSATTAGFTSGQGSDAFNRLNNIGMLMATLCISPETDRTILTDLYRSGI